MGEQVQKHVPMRKCIATGEHFPKKDLMRLVAVMEDGSKHVYVDTTGKLRGRGANITPTLEAFELAIKKGAIEYSLQLERKLTKDEIDNLRESFINAISQREFRKGKKPIVFKIKKEELEKKLGE